MFKKLKTLLFSFLVLVSVGNMAHARTLDEIIKSGTLRVGILPNSPPQSSIGASNQLEGFDVDVANKLAASLGVKVDFVMTEIAQRVPFLVADRIDICLGGLTRTVERAKSISYTVPLHTESMGVLTTNKVNISNWKELNDEKYTLVLIRGVWTADFLKQNLPKAKILYVDTMADTIRALAQGRADALVENIEFYVPFTKNYPNVQWKVLPDALNTSYDAVGLAQNNYALRDVLNVALYDMHTSGFVNQTWEKWFKAPMLVKVVPSPYF
ncbi:transporter substrate-binding domain-containing protein [Pantoea sp. BAV 3049]|uniref:transporter substrate-binding domain-containing protein n=1 Tax=Pantoea sp. BAV 3049 TaxID=2654188 RepID=UPI00131CFDCB|nr:transporter substrate-binding domain-containing protein [Pantoea sp. BAV 3049]